MLSKITLSLTIMLVCLGSASAHEMQHGFILSEDDIFASHLVANGHHSRQVELLGHLVIPDAGDLAHYRNRKTLSSANRSYFVLQAQHLDLPSLTAGMVLAGHIIESQVGNYEPKNIIVQSAMFEVQKVLLNIPNPFFGAEPARLSSQTEDFLNKAGLKLLLGPNKEKRHCCETGERPCNWKC